MPSEWEPAPRQGGDDEWRHEEERFRTPLDQVENYAIILLDPRGKPTSWNPGIRSVLGYEKAEFLQLAAADLYPPRPGRAALRAQTSPKRSGRGGSRSSGGWCARTALASGDRCPPRACTISGGICSVSPAACAICRIKKRWRSSSVASRTPSSWRSRPQAWERGSTTARRVASSWTPEPGLLFGLADDEPPTPGRWLDAVHPDDRERTLERWERAVRERASYSAEYRVVWPDGSVHWVMAVGRCVPEPANRRPLHFTGVVLDLTERRRTEEHLQESLRLEAVGRLAGGIAHDLNNMLAAIMGFGDLLGRSLDPDDPRATDVEQISRAATRSASLTRQLLAFARREMIQPRALDINSVIRHAQALLPPTLGENVELDLRLAPEVGVVYADARQIEQIIMNLVFNARDAMPQGGRVTIETDTVMLGPGAGVWRSEEDRALSGRFTVLSVTDTGHGMDAATLRRIWEPFFTTKPPGHGTGLGLSSVYGAAKQSGGFVWADSEPGRGTTVQVYWPEIRAAVEPLAEPESPRPVVGGSETVLIVEDEDLVRALAVRALRSFGYTCLEARDAGEALRLLDEQRAAGGCRRDGRGDARNERRRAGRAAGAPASGRTGRLHLGVHR